MGLIRYFDADTQLNRDRALYENEKRRLQGLAILQELVAGKEAELSKLRGHRDSLKSLQNRIESFSDGVGFRCSRNLQDMAKTGRREVEVTGIRIRPYVEDGKQLHERTDIAISIGTINGLSIFRPGIFLSLYERMNAIVRAYDRAAHLSDPIRNKDVNELRAVLDDSARVAGESKELSDAEMAFMSSDLLSLPFLVGDQSERYKTTRFVLGLSGKGSSKDKAKQWLLGREGELKIAYGVQRIEIRH